MNYKLYFLIGAIFLLYIIYSYFLKKKAFKKSKITMMDLSPENEDSSCLSLDTNADLLEPLDDSKKRLLAYGAILAYHKNEHILSMNLKSNVSTYVQGLKLTWEINNSFQAHERITNLINLKRSKEFDSYLLNPTEKILKIRKRVAKEMKLNIQTVNETTSTYGWDIVRVIPLIKWSFWVGYISEDECWEYMNSAVNVAQQNGKSWTDYTVSFLIGRAMQGLDISQISAEAYAVLNGKQPLFEKIPDLEVIKSYSFH